VCFSSIGSAIKWHAESKGFRRIGIVKRGNFFSSDISNAVKTEGFYENHPMGEVVVSFDPTWNCTDVF
jgi:hypothetical protein